MTTTETQHQLATEYKNMYAERAATNPAAFTLGFWQEHFATQTVRSVAGLKGNILDTGCGTGEIDIWLARAKGDVRITGVDVCREALDVAEKHRALEPVEIHQRLSFCESVIEKLPFADSSFDSCFISHTLEHIRSHDAVFRELYRVVRPEGTVVIIVPLGHFHDDPTHVWHFQPEQLQLHLSWFGENVKVWKSPDGQQLAASMTLPRRPRIIGMLRIKNEERWILPTLEKASSVVDGFVILDDGSTDKTPELCRSNSKVLRYEYQREPVTDEARDKDKVLQWTLDVNPDWILALDGDELLEDAASILLRRAISSCPRNVSAFGLTFLYMWDTHDRHRVDNKYQSLKHLRLFRVSDLGMPPRHLKFKTTEHGSNFHCGSVPGNLPGESVYLDVNVKHYGYFERAQRERKQVFYVQRDPVNAAKGYYHHLTDETGMITLPWKERDITELASAEYREEAD